VLCLQVCTLAFPNVYNTDKHLFAGCFTAVAVLCSYGQMSHWLVVFSIMAAAAAAACSCVPCERLSHVGGRRLQQSGVLHSMCIAPVYWQSVFGLLGLQMLHTHSSVQCSFVICPQPQTMLGELANCTFSCCYSVLYDVLCLQCGFLACYEE
jgi:hypothetical protein